MFKANWQYITNHYKSTLEREKTIVYKMQAAEHKAWNNKGKISYMITVIENC